MTTIACFGEGLLRFSSPHSRRLFQGNQIEADFGGSEANVAAAISQFGGQAAFVSGLPDNPIGYAFVRHFKSLGVDTSQVVLAPGRLGLYFFESGAAQRSPRVIYDREGTVFAEICAQEIDWQHILAKSSWFHVSGITPGLTRECAVATHQGIETANEMGLTTSCDLNYRASLWRWGKDPSEVMPEIVRNCHVLIGNVHQFVTMLGIKREIAEVPAENDDLAEMVMRQVKKEFPNLRTIALTSRSAKGSSSHSLAAWMLENERCLAARSHVVSPIVDRIGSGDAFVGGLIYGLAHLNDPQDAIEFASAARVFKHAIPGDQLLGTAEEILELAAADRIGMERR